MPTVPVIQTQVANVGGIGGYSSPQSAPVIDQRPQMIAQAGQAMSQSAEQWAQLEAQRRRREDVAAHTEREAALGAQDTEQFVGYNKLQGREAVQGFDGFVADMDKRYKAALESAPEGNQREWLRQHLASQRQRMFASAVAHREKQTVVWRAASATADEEQAQQKAVAMWQSPDAPSLVAEARAKSDELATMNGLEGTAKQQFVAERMSNLHSQTLDVMLTEQRLGQATKYFQENGAEIDPVAKAKIGAKLKAQAIEEGARMLDATVGSYGERLARVQEMVQDKLLTPEEGASAMRHLRQLDAERRQQNAIVAEDVRARAQQWSNEHPHLRLEVENPQLAAEVQQAGVVLERQVDDPVFREYMRTDRGMAELQAMPDEELRFTLRNRLTPREAALAEKHIRGDQSGVTIGQLTKALAIDSGVIPAQSADGEAGVNAQALLNWERNTIAPLVASARNKLGHDLSPTEFQDLIVTPLSKDKVWKKATTFGADWASKDEEMTVLKAQSLKEGGLPVDDPATRDVDESLDVSNNAFYVKVGGEEVRLSSIPMQVRRKIREAYRQEWVAQHGSADGMPMLTAAEEARRWISDGRVGDKSARSTGREDRIPGVGWGVGDLNREDLPDLAGSSDLPDQYILPGIKIEPRK